MREALKNGPKGKNGEDASAVAEKMFSAMDDDGDGSVGSAAGRQRRRFGVSSSSSSSQSYDAPDTNKDGVVSLSERLAAGKDSAAMSGNLSCGTLGALLAGINEVAA